MAFEDKLDLSKQRLLLTIALYFVVSLVVYSYLYDILFIFLFCMAAWYANDYIKQYTKQTLDPTGKFVFITGCDTGFGLESAKAIRDLGFGVIAGCYDDNSVGAVELRARPWVKKIEVIHMDVTNEASVLACAKEVKDICQDQGLWAVINNAGINCMGPVELVNMEMFQRTAEVNLFGAIRTTKAVLPLIRQAGGRIINVTSERGFNPRGESSPYCVSKFGLEAFSTCLRSEMVPFGVKVITVAPGAFGGATDIINHQRDTEMAEKLLKSHSNLPIQDQETTYNRDQLANMPEFLAKLGGRSASTSGPVVQAYIDAVMNLKPETCYLVHGTRRLYLDPGIVTARMRPFFPVSIFPTVEKLVYRLSG